MVSLTHSEDVVTHKQGLMLRAPWLFDLRPGNCFGNDLLCEESTESALQESTTAWALRKQAEPFLVP